MRGLRDVLGASVDNGSVPGAVALVAQHEHVEVQAVGSVDLASTAAMTRDSIFRLASITKPIVAAAVMTLIEDGRLTPHDPVTRWLPELAEVNVVRSPDGPVDDVVPANRPITVFDLLSSHAGYGLAPDFSLPAVKLLFDELHKHGPNPQSVRTPEQWMEALSRIPLLHQPGDAWLYNTCSDLQGVLISRASGQSLPEFLAERIFEPLGMVDTGFAVPASKLDRFTSYYKVDAQGELDLLDAPDGQWSSLPLFPSGAGGLVSTVDDWHAFAQMLLAEGRVGDRKILSPESVRQMTTDHTTQSQRDTNGIFLEGQGWGFGGSVDVAAIEPWNVPGRYGWVGGTGTAAHLIPKTGQVTILLTQVAMTSPTPPVLMRDFWRYTAKTGESIS